MFAEATLRRSAVQWTDAGIGALTTGVLGAILAYAKLRSDGATTKQSNDATVTVRFVELGENLIEKQDQRISALEKRVEELQAANNALQEINRELRAENRSQMQTITALTEQLADKGLLPSLPKKDGA